MKSDDENHSPVAEICLVENALPETLFARLFNAIQAVGDERMEGNGSYTTTFWYPRDAEPTNVAEESVAQLLKQVNPGPECIGTEWWLGRLGQGKELRLHFDRDLALKRETGESIHPLLSSVFYLNAFPGSPTVILDQVLANDGKTMVPKEAEFGKAFEAEANHYVVFPGNLRHGVIPNWGRSESTSSPQKTPGLRLTLLVNYWHRRPMGPICNNYDGTIYPALRDSRI